MNRCWTGLSVFIDTSISVTTEMPEISDHASPISAGLLDGCAGRFAWKRMGANRPRPPFSGSALKRGYISATVNTRWHAALPNLQPHLVRADGAQAES